MAVDRLLAVMQQSPDPALSALATELVPRQARRRDTLPLTLFDVARSYTRRVPMAKSLVDEKDVRLYLACVLVDAVHQAGEALVVPQGMAIDIKSMADWGTYKQE
jgi:hypothetical protein